MRANKSQSKEYRPDNDCPKCYGIGSFGAVGNEVDKNGKIIKSIGISIPCTYWREGG